MPSTAQIFHVARGVAALALLAALFGDGPPAAPRAAVPGSSAAISPARIETEQRVAEGVDAERAQRRVRELVALGPRMGGTTSGERSAAYLRERFTELGLQARIVLDRPLAASEFSAWKLRARWGTAPWTELESAWPLLYSRSGAGRATLHLEPHAGAALLSAKRPRFKSGQALPELVLIDGSSTLDGSHPLPNPRSSAETWPALALSRADGEALRGALARGESVEVEWEIQGSMRTAPVQTVLASIPAASGAPDAGSPSGAYFLFCAHADSDSSGPGANDNASGLAVLLEIAAAWSRALREGLAEPLACELRFAAWGAEIHSSGEYLKGAYAGEQAILGVLNFDQAGFGSAADVLYLEPDDLPANRALVRSILGVLRDHAPPPREDRAPAPPAAFPERWATVKSLSGTDSYVFSGSSLFTERQLPALTIYASAWGRPAEHRRTEGMPGESWRERELVEVDYDLYYHSSGDVPERTTDREPWNMAWCARIALLGARRYLTEGR
jgi:hypothetical protein